MVFNNEDLHKGEEIIKEVTLSRWGVWGYYLFALLTVVTIILPIILILIAEMTVKGTKYYITNKRVIYDFQFINKKRTSVKYSNIQDLEVNQGLFERMVGIGSINLNTSGSNGIELSIADVIEPYETKKLVDEIIQGDYGSASTGTFECSECGEQVEDNVKFCPSCGANFEEDNECSKCHHINKEGAKFCSECGGKLKK